MKMCMRCQVEQPFENFPAGKKHVDGLNSWCRPCYANRASEWYYANKKRAKIARAAYYIENAGKIKERSSAWQKANPGKVNEGARRRYAENPGPILDYQARQRAENPEKERKRHAKYAKENPEKRAVTQQRRRARKAEIFTNDLTAAQWLEILIAYKYRCVYCPPTCWHCRNKKHVLTQDHITPVFDGGPYTLWNIVPACNKCNARKHAGPPPVPVQPLLLTLAPPKR